MFGIFAMNKIMSVANMKKLYFTFITLLMSFSLYLKGQTQSEMNHEAAESFHKADSILNDVYQRIGKEYADDPVFLKKLKVSQRLWIQFRDAELEARFPDDDLMTYGSMYSMCYASVKKKLTIDRINQLNVWLEGLPETDGCMGSVKFVKD